MIGITEYISRQVVPRWRSSEASRQRGELAPLKSAEETRPDPDQVAVLVDDWKKSQSLSVAADLVSSAYTLALDDVAVDAARFVLAHGSATPSARSIAALYLRLPSPLSPAERIDNATAEASGSSTNPLIPRRYQLEIHRLRGQLAQYPRNPLLWSNLARLFTVVDAREKAVRAMWVALSLARNDRFILRNASRLYMHQDDPQKALDLLRTSERLKFDPWILSAEIAISDSHGKTSKFIKQANRILEAEWYAPFHLSELASALGTLEARDGKAKAGRKLVLRSLQDPTENSIAQASWLARNKYINIDVVYGGSNEAGAWSASRSARWTESIDEARAWQEDQPFSSRPASFGSHLAGVLDEHAVAVDFARQGTLSNADNFSIQNNLAFSYLHLGKLHEASEIVERVTAMDLAVHEKVVLTATTGLYHFRAGSPEAGRLLYQSAADGFRLQKQKDLEMVARIYWALEECRIRSEFAEACRKHALENVKDAFEPWIGVLVDRLRRSF